MEFCGRAPASSPRMPSLRQKWRIRAARPANIFSPRN